MLILPLLNYILKNMLPFSYVRVYVVCNSVTLIMQKATKLARNINVKGLGPVVCSFWAPDMYLGSQRFNLHK